MHCPLTADCDTFSRDSGRITPWWLLFFARMQQLRAEARHRPPVEGDFCRFVLVDLSCFTWGFPCHTNWTETRRRWCWHRLTICGYRCSRRCPLAVSCFGARGDHGHKPQTELLYFCSMTDQLTTDWLFCSPESLSQSRRDFTAPNQPPGNPWPRNRTRRSGNHRVCWCWTRRIPEQTINNVLFGCWVLLAGAPIINHRHFYRQLLSAGMIFGSQREKDMWRD